MAMFFASKAHGEGASRSGKREMKLNPKILWGFAWAGLALIVAVPSADILTSGFGKDDAGSAAVLTSDVTAVTTPKPAASAPAPAASATTPAAKSASLAPTLTPVTATEVTATRTANGVIITPPGGALPATTPATPAAPAVTEVASADPVTTTTKIVPRPMDSWLRPTGPVPPAATTTVAPALPQPATSTAALPPITAPVTPVAPAQEPALIIEQPRQPSGPTPPSPIVDDSANWEEESLRDYLERRGILSGSSTSSSATVTQRQVSPTYDPDGFYLSDGPRGGAPSADERFWELFEEDPEGFTVF
jgi:hypothetical protein